MQQLNTFVGKPDKRQLLTIYEAELGNHDDCISPLILLGWLTAQSGFENYVGLSMRQLLMEGGESVDLEMPFEGFFDQSTVYSQDIKVLGNRIYDVIDEGDSAAKDFWKE